MKLPPYDKSCPESCPQSVYSFHITVGMTHFIVNLKLLPV